MISIGRVDVDINNGRATAVAISRSLPLVTKVTRQILNRAKVLAPVRTGRLRSSGRMDIKVTHFGPTGTVTFPVRYAQFVHDGTRPHLIVPKHKKVLKFKVGPRVLYRPLVHHPGTRPRPFLSRAMVEVAPASNFLVTV
jgi:Bacteriophage protein of unknown function (DUF646).